VTPRVLQVGDVVQLAPDVGHAFGACFMLVTETKSWGAQGFVAMPLERGKAPGEAYMRATWEQMEFVGHASWVPADIAAEVEP
jgi:hypothetical protein